MLEIELKFQIHASRRNALLKAIDPNKSKSLTLQAKYYDTPQKHLAQAKAALRQRLEGDVWIQTFKASKNHLIRYEHNHNLGSCTTSPPLDLSIYQQNTEAKTIFDQAIGHAADQLHLVFETDIQRTVRIIEFQNSQIELSLDVGEIRANGQTQDVYEIEFELKNGSIQDLLTFSFEWVKKYQLWLDVRSKAEFGQLLADHLKVSPAQTAPIFQLSKKDSADFNVRTLIAQQLQHLLPHIAAISANVAEKEHIEQAHLALKNLYFTVSVLQAWSPHISTKWTTQLAAFKQQFEHVEHFNHMQNTVGALLQNPNTAQSLNQDILYAHEKLHHLVRSSQNVHHFLELLMFSLDTPITTQALDLKGFAQSTLQHQYKQLQDVLKHASVHNFEALDALIPHLQALKFSFPILTHIYDVKNLQKYAKALNDAELAAQEYHLLSLSNTYLQQSELAASDWFVLGWLTAKQELYAERMLDTIEQFLISRKFLK